MNLQFFFVSVAGCKDIQHLEELAKKAENYFAQQSVDHRTKQKIYQKLVAAYHRVTGLNLASEKMKELFPSLYERLPLFLRDPELKFSVDDVDGLIRTDIPGSTFVFLNNSWRRNDY